MDKPAVMDFSVVHRKEAERIRQRRHAAWLEDNDGKVPPDAAFDPGDPLKDAVGLALSGGGIRSATFNLGVLQALARYRVLRRIDYLSTVSGGGYIGACLTWFMSQNRKPFPFGTTRADHVAGGKVLAWLREHGKYLTPGGALNVWALAGAVLSGMLATLTVLVPVCLLGVYALGQPWTWLGTAPAARWLPAWPAAALRGDGFAWLLSAALAALALFLLLATLYAVGTSWRRLRSSSVQRIVHAAGGSLLATGVSLLAVGALPWAYLLLRENLADWLGSAMSGVTLSGAAAIAAALRGREAGSETRGWRAVTLGLGLALACYGLLLWFYHLMGPQRAFALWLGGPTTLWYALGLAAVLALLANINHVSMHRFYRNRLMEAYMPEHLAEAVKGSADLCRLSAIPQTVAPYHLINANVQLSGSDNVKCCARGGDSFFFAPEYCGAGSTGFARTADFAGGMVNLATALAVSGAAVEPNTFATRSRPLTFLMTLFNVRLGYWISNPRHPAWIGALWRPRWYWYLFREMLGKGLTERAWQIHLSDGGHFENLGLYELIRRRCRYILVSDAGADPGFTFADLAHAIELVRTDFGVGIDLKVETLKPRGEDALSPGAFVLGDIYYDDGPEPTGRIIYLKATMLDGLPEDVNGYRRQHRTFPHQSTADQFFDEAQFEAYRELGYQIGKRLAKDWSGADLKTLFTKSG